jgi:hypothetical protein
LRGGGEEDSSSVSKEYNVVDVDTEEEKGEDVPHITSNDVLNLD